MDKILTTDNIKNLGLVGMLTFILWANFSGQWVWGTQLKEEQNRTTSAIADRDKWMKLALEGTKLAEVSANKTMAVLNGVPVPPVVKKADEKPMSAEEVKSKLEELHNRIEPGIER